MGGPLACEDSEQEVVLRGVFIETHGQFNYYSSIVRHMDLITGGAADQEQLEK